MTTTDQAERAIQAIDTAADRVAAAITSEAAAEDVCAEELSALVNSLIGQTNPLTNKPHSATSAEAAAKETVTYKTARQRRTEAEIETARARAALESAKLRAKLLTSIASAGLESGILV